MDDYGLVHLFISKNIIKGYLEDLIWNEKK